MGVTGWNRLLTEHGYLPHSDTTRCCSTSLWNKEHCNTGNERNDGPTSVEFYFHQTATGSTSNADASSPQPLRPSKYETIKYGSEFHVDGYGLCYHIIATAYARHIDSVLHSKMNHVERPCARTTITNLSIDQARRLNPNFAIPNSLIHEVTKEFVQTINLCHVTMTIYWDGPQRYIHKYATDKKRNIERNNSHVNLYHYCTNGTLPNIEKTSSNYNEYSNRLCQYMLNNFPLSKLYMTQIYHTLHVLKKIRKVECINEADTILAQAVQCNPKAYILGFDSDFCFYEDVQYIPIPTMQIHKVHQNDHTKSFMMACVVSRQILASTLHLPDSNSMIELAILLGNDFITPTLTKNNHQWNNDHIKEELFSNSLTSKSKNGREFKLAVDMIILYLQNQACGFELASSNPEIEQTVQFIRRVYNLQPEPPSSVLATTLIYDQEDLIRTLQEESNSSMFGIHQPYISNDEIKAMDITIPQQPSSKKGSTTMKDIMLRSLRNYIQYTLMEVGNGNNEEEKNNLRISYINVTPDHLMALEQLKLKDGQSYSTVDQALTKINCKNWRPSYDDTCVVYLIEKVIIQIIESNTTSIFTQLNSPYMIFDPYKYYIQLLLVREGNNIGSAPPTAPKQSGNVRNGRNKTLKSRKKSGSSNAIGGNTISISNAANNESMVNDNDDADKGGKVAEPRPVLPVDEFEDKIVQSVYSNRVTIIQGETGCGKLLFLFTTFIRHNGFDLTEKSQCNFRLYYAETRQIIKNSHNATTRCSATRFPS